MMTEFKTVSEAVAAAYEALGEAERIALETGEGFSFSPAYAMGGYFDPESIDEDMGTHWRPSSLNC
jgi:hypothetical protein